MHFGGPRYESAQIESFRQGDSTNSSSRKRHHDDEYLREDGERGRGECDEEPGKHVCNYCATRGTRKFARPRSA
jgi:hypothetical protein